MKKVFTFQASITFIAEDGSPNEWYDFEVSYHDNETALKSVKLLIDRLNELGIPIPVGEPVIRDCCKHMEAANLGE